ncbi:DUF4468 domain-containing protein [Bacteroides sp. 519]|uniref:DUF4468 domain-containing protein n=1 Tax=Bacteroides sp. 519 TaxID=2302937 RepID=UPI0013D7B428|nr:DUF4468 domain-containing protein [Bacteroides sp. 519]NDV59792.1 DUF4468 domain-containing protein [Bacteroides sp. 519]
MKKQFSLLFILLVCLPFALNAQEDARYLAGAVPEEDGKIVFKKEFSLPGTSKEVIYNAIHQWMEDRLKQNENNSRVVYTDESKGIISGTVEEYLVFKSSALSLDRAIINYQINATCSTGECILEVERIRYTYEDEKLTAEDYISDKNALNKTQTKLVRGLSKFRIKTVDYFDELFAGAQSALALNVSGMATPEPVVTIPQQRVTVKTTVEESAVRVTTPTAPTPITTTAAPITTSAPITTTAANLDGYRQIAPDKLPGNIIKMLNDDWMLITAGTKDQFNMMTASWGGLGMLYGKPIAMCFINPTRYTYQLMEKNDTYTFTFYTEAYRDALKYCGSTSGKNTDKVKGSGLTPITTPNGSQAFGEAWLIIECRKLVSQSITPEAINNEKVKEEWIGKQLHKMYIGEIINVWVK